MYDVNSANALRPTKTAVIVAHALAERVASLAPGDLLPPERELIAELHVGRNTLREALRLLEVQGVVTVKTGARGGPVVSRPDHRPLADTLSVFLQAAEAAYIEVVRARRVIEADMAWLAAEHGSDEDIAAIRESAVRMESLLDDEAKFFDENLRFHHACAVAAHNSVLQVFHSSLKAVSDGHIIGISYSARRRAAILAAHRRVLEAIEARDAEASHQAMDDHMLEFEEYLKRRYPEILSRRIRWLLPSR
jgi:GntR family transcriptional regulator, transcriptional repressor for pyruvate dehydrogenase complex